MEKVLVRVGEMQETTIYWLVFDTNQSMNPLDRTLYAYITGYYPPFDSAMNVAESLPAEEKAVLTWVRDAVMNAVVIDDECHPVMSVRTPVMGEKEHLPGRNAEDAEHPLNSIAMSFRRRLTQQEILHIYARARAFATTSYYEEHAHEPFIISGYRVIEETRSEICTVVWSENDSLT